MRPPFLLLPALLAAAPAAAGVLDALKERGAAVRPLGNLGGLAGHLVTLADGSSYALYTTPDGHAVAGLLYDPDGELVTSRQLAGLPGEGGRLEAPSGNEALLRSTLSAAGFTVGDRGPLVAAFADPECRWSNAAVASLAREARRGELRLRVIPLGILGAASARRAAAIASSPDPERAWFDPARASEPRPGGALAVERNDRIFDLWRKGGVPLLLWRDGERIAWRVGDVDDARAWLRRTFGGDDDGE